MVDDKETEAQRDPSAQKAKQTRLGELIAEIEQLELLPGWLLRKLKQFLARL